jgi:pimeloyl-ACP methyl ester carboxylesterase
VLSSKYGDHKIRYQFQGQREIKTSQQNPFFASIDSLLNGSRIGGGGKKKIKPAVICIHGFGGNADQFRKNLPVLSANGYDTYAIDLLGYGYR